MPEPASSTASRIADLARAVAALEARTAALEARIAGQAPATDLTIEVPAAPTHTVAPAEMATTPRAGPGLPALGPRRFGVARAVMDECYLAQNAIRLFLPRDGMRNKYRQASESNQNESRASTGP